MAKTKKLNKTQTLNILTRKCNDFHPAVVESALDMILRRISVGLTMGQSVTLRGFGRFIPRFYPLGLKKVGLLFHPSEKLASRVNKRVNSIK
ncbi:MAG: hypothetical protein LBU69_04855 [Deltaproteobacteria bacterium]|jgi:hypothetical protein|nr:hypothetical protein [Deltaproteobacteria bacterium]